MEKSKGNRHYQIHSASSPESAFRKEKLLGPASGEAEHRASGPFSLEQSEFIEMVQACPLRQRRKGVADQRFEQSQT
jgi:hypothetical protein